MSTNFVGNTLTQSQAIETYTPYDVTSSRPRKMTIAFFCQLWRDRKIILRAGPELKFENYESVPGFLLEAWSRVPAPVYFEQSTWLLKV